MTMEFFLQQWQRLVNRFGAKAMDEELRRLCAIEVDVMGEGEFLNAVNVWIGSRTHMRPPLLTDFREARLAVEKRKLSKEVNAATVQLREPKEMQEHLSKTLSLNYGPVESVAEAVEVARLKLINKK